MQDRGLWKGRIRLHEGGTKGHKMCGQCVSRLVRKQAGRETDLLIQIERHKRELSGRIPLTLDVLRKQQPPNVVLQEAGETPQPLCVSKDCKISSALE